MATSRTIAEADGNFRGPIFRSGRQESAPLGGYGVDAGALDNYAQASDLIEDAADDPLAALQANIPGVPGEDYPIFSFPVPETAFSCDGQVNGGQCGQRIK